MPTTNKISNKLGQAGEKVSKVDTKIETPNKKVSKIPKKKKDSLPKTTTNITPNVPNTDFNLSTAIKEHKLYKKDIGHTQGASTIVELGMLLDEVVVGTKSLVLASGMGGFYGGCTVSK